MNLSTDGFPLPQPTPLKKRLGLFAVRIGAQMAHTLGIEVLLEEPEYPTVQLGASLKARQRIPTKGCFAYGKNPRDGSPVAVKALPGAVVYLAVQDLSHLEPELVREATWLCTHPECAGKRWESKDALASAHAKNKDLVAAAEADPRGGHAHAYYGALEIGATPEQPATVTLISDEE